MSRGGKRAGSGRLKKDKTTVISFRVPADKAEEVKQKVKQLIISDMKNKKEIIELILWENELTPSIIKLVNSQLEYGIKYRLLSDMVDNLTKYKDLPLSEIWNVTIKEQEDDLDFLLIQDLV